MYGEASGLAEPLHTSLKDCLDTRFHADPLGTTAAMAIDPAVNIVAFDANVVGVRAAVSPPFRRPEKPNHRRPRGNGNVGRPRVTADVKA